MRSSDEEHVVRLLSRTLGWVDDERHRALFQWKHRLNPFGSSPGWVAEDGEGLAGFRTLMRWEFLYRGAPLRAVRAVDTATDPRAQGRGIFRALTLQGVDEMTAEGVSFVFNTPNPQSTPGYLSMGWQQMGHLPVSFRPSGLGVLPRMLFARTPADLWSLSTAAGANAADVLDDEPAIARLLSAVPAGEPGTGLSTHRTSGFLRWRYGTCPVGYRALLAGSSPEDGLVLFRLRTRGGATEATIEDTIAPNPRVARRLRSAVLAASRADYAVALGATRPRTWPRLPVSGPLLTWRPLRWEQPPPTLGDWSLSAGDVELF